MTSHRSGIEFLLQHNQQQSQAYRSPDAALARRQYKAQHPTAICALKCMDGRLNLPVITQVQPGIIQPWRNLGGKFSLGWPYFNRLMLDWVHHTTKRGHDCLVLITYHYSKGDSHRGCRGFDYDKTAAIEYTTAIKKEFELLFGKQHTAVYPVQIGIETDEDTLIIHGENGEVVDVSTLPSDKPQEMLQLLHRLFPDMKERVVQDFLPLLVGNSQHIQEIKASNRPIADIEHKEWVLGIGRGFDWLHNLNTAFIIGPYSPNLAEPILVGANLLLDNVKSGRVDPKNGLVLMVSSPTYRAEGPDWEAAALKSQFLADLTMSQIDEHVPELKQYIEPLVGVVNMQTLEFTPTGK